MIDETGMGSLLLIFTVCTLAEPAICEERTLAFNSPSVSLRGCAAQAQPAIAQWAGEHPGLQVARWRCAVPAAEKSKI